MQKEKRMKKDGGQGSELLNVFVAIFDDTRFVDLKERLDLFRIGSAC